MKDVYNKLVRDKIPDIIRNQGDSPKTEILGSEKYFAALNRKLQEEVAEYLEEYNLYELADIMEVILAIAEYKGLTAEKLEAMRLNKRQERGGFSGRIALIKVDRKQA